jgi:hypothetical protein
MWNSQSLPLLATDDEMLRWRQTELVAGMVDRWAVTGGMWNLYKHHLYSLGTSTITF